MNSYFKFVSMIYSIGSPGDARETVKSQIDIRKKLEPITFE